MMKQNIKIRNNRRRAAGASPRSGFSMIELLVVISIIGILAGVAGPALVNAQQAARASAAMQKARQIALGLRGFSLDNAGAFPEGENIFGESITTSNAAFRDLVDYLDDETVFAVSGSNWGAAADNRIDGAGEFLRPGENHFAYIAGLDSLSRSTWPLIVDGTDGQGTFTTDRTQRGGIWAGKRGVLVRCDGSGSVERLGRSGDGSRRFLPRDGEPRENALELSYIGEGVKLLDPEG